MKYKFLLLFILAYAWSYAQETKSQLTTRFDVIRNETATGGNTRARIANAYQELADGTIGIDPVHATGTDTYLGSLIGLDSYSGHIVFVTFLNPNTGAATLNLNSIGASNLMKDSNGDGTWEALDAGDLQSGTLYRVYHDGSRWQVDLGGAAGVESVTGDGVDNTDPANPVVELDLQDVLNNGATAVLNSNMSITGKGGTHSFILDSLESFAIESMESSSRPRTRIESGFTGLVLWTGNPFGTGNVFYTEHNSSTTDPYFNWQLYDSANEVSFAMQLGMLHDGLSINVDPIFGGGGTMKLRPSYGNVAFSGAVIGTGVWVRSGDKGDVTVGGISSTSPDFTLSVDLGIAEIIGKDPTSLDLPQVDTVARVIGMLHADSSLVLIDRSTLGSYTNEQAQDAVGSMIDASLTYVDGTPLLQRSALTGDVTAAAGSNTTAIATGAIVNSDVNASAGIDATKLADGSVSNSELQSLGTITTVSNGYLLKYNTSTGRIEQGGLYFLSDYILGNSFNTGALWLMEDYGVLVHTGDLDVNAWDSLRLYSGDGVLTFNGVRIDIVSNTTSTAGSTITIDMLGAQQRVVQGSASFSTPKTVAMDNEDDALNFTFSFQITDVAAVLTLPTDFLLGAIPAGSTWDGDDWTPDQTGTYIMAGIQVGSNWHVNISGPYN